MRAARTDKGVSAICQVARGSSSGVVAAGAPAWSELTSSCLPPFQPALPPSSLPLPRQTRVSSSSQVVSAKLVLDDPPNQLERIAEALPDQASSRAPGQHSLGTRPACAITCPHPPAPDLCR